MSLETRIAELEKKFGRYGQPRIQYRMRFVDATLHEVVSVCWADPGHDPRDSGPGRHFFEREPNESEADFLTRVDQPKETP
jgi:hypothetical protein